jgi:hypothetical protein
MPVPMFNDDARRHSITNALPLRVHVCTLVRCSKLNAGTEARGDPVLTTK